MQIFETSDRAQFNDFLISQNASVLQSWQWGEFQKKMGRKVWRLFLTTNTGKSLAAATIVKMPVPQGKSYFYCPRGPVISSSPHIEKIWRFVLDKLSDLQMLEKPIFFRADPQISQYPGDFELNRLGFLKIPWEIQPKATLLLNLQQTEEQLLHQMKPKTRYNIHLAQKKGVTTEDFTDGRKIKIFWELLRQTTKRDSFSAHPYLYYCNLLEVLGKSDSARLLIAIYLKRPLAAAIITSFASTATYLHGASSDRFKNIMSPYLVQWAAIKTAKAAGAKFYDFGGIAPVGAGSAHSWAGITRFKKSFGGKEVNYVGAYDLPYDKFWYRLYRLARGLSRVLRV